MRKRISGVAATWLFLSTCLFSVSAVGGQQTNSGVLHEFGNWRIEIERSNESLLLIGVVSEGTGAYIALQCYSKVDWYWLWVPLFDPRELKKVEKNPVAQITIWNDHSGATTVDLPVMAGRGAGGKLDMVLLEKSDPIALPTFLFFNKLKDAKTFFALEAGGASRTYDMRHFSAAHGVFNQKCAEIRESWANFVRRN